MRNKALSISVAIDFFISLPLSGQKQQRSQIESQFKEDVKDPNVLDADYHKLDKLTSFLRKRNAEEFAINRQKGVMAPNIP